MSSRNWSVSMTAIAFSGRDWLFQWPRLVSVATIGLFSVTEIGFNSRNKLRLFSVAKIGPFLVAEIVFCSRNKSGLFPVAEIGFSSRNKFGLFSVAEIGFGSRNWSVCGGRDWFQ